MQTTHRATSMALATNGSTTTTQTRHGTPAIKKRETGQTATRCTHMQHCAALYNAHSTALHHSALHTSSGSAAVPSSYTSLHMRACTSVVSPTSSKQCNRIIHSCCKALDCQLGHQTIATKASAIIELHAAPAFKQCQHCKDASQLSV